MITKTTIENVTSAQIRALRNEAGEAGDLAMVAICDRAMGGGPGAYRAPTDSERIAVVTARAMSRRAAIAECARVIADAEVQS